MSAVSRLMLVLAAILAISSSASAQITIAPENRCSPYDRSDYSYPQSIELRIIAENLNGQIISPYTGEIFSSRSETDIEHIVATSEAHDSGLCASSAAMRRQYARDLDNLTLASPSLNRYQKSAKDLAEWTPPRSVCWFAQTVVNVKAEYKLSMDSREANAALQILQSCDPRPQCQSLDNTAKLNCYAGYVSGNAGGSVAPAPTSSASCFASDTAYVTGTMNMRAEASVNSAKVGSAQPGAYAVSDSAQGGTYCWLQISGGWIAKTDLVSAAQPNSGAPSQPTAQTPQQATPTPAQPAQVNALDLYDDNGNGRITCAEARNHGIAPVRRGHPAYQYMNDRDNDGTVCE